MLILAYSDAHLEQEMSQPLRARFGTAPLFGCNFTKSVHRVSIPAGPLRKRQIDCLRSVVRHTARGDKANAAGLCYPE